MYNDGPETHAEFMGIAIGWWLLIGGLVLATSATAVCVQPWFTQKNTEITRQSNEYITAKQSALRSLKNSYDALESRKISIEQSPDNIMLVQSISLQQLNIIKQMRELADLIPGHVQDDIATFLSVQN